MTENIAEDPELLDDPEEGVGYEVEGAEPVELPPFDPTQFELPEDFELEEETEEGEENG